MNGNEYKALIIMDDLDSIAMDHERQLSRMKKVYDEFAKAIGHETEKGSVNERIETSVREIY